MVSAESVEKQLKRINFNVDAWGRTEARELPNILLPDEEIYEAVNGIYEGGFALLVATDVRLLLVDKKPLKFLTVEDLRFDMINELDYSHRLLGAQISISAGAKNLKFRSYNQPRLRKCINHVQHSMAEAKKTQYSHQVGQNQHLENLNQQLQAYLLAQHKAQRQLNERLEQAQQQGAKVEPLRPQDIKPSPELADFLFAQSLLLEQGNQTENNQYSQTSSQSEKPEQPAQPAAAPTTPQQPGKQNDLDEMASAGRREIFGAQMADQMTGQAVNQQAQVATQQFSSSPEPITTPPTVESTTSHSWMGTYNPLEINPLRVAYSKLPMALRNRKFGRPSFHAHSQSIAPFIPTPPPSQPNSATQ